MKVVTTSSMPPQILETEDLEMPVWLPKALTRSSTLRVETLFDPGGADHRVQRLVDSPAGMQQRGEERTFA